MENIEYDMCGQICPSSLLQALKVVNSNIERLENGDVTITIMTDNRDATSTIPESVGNMGYDVKVTKTGDFYRIDIKAQK